MTTAVSAPHADDPMASTGGQFALRGSTFTDRAHDQPSPVGARPWGLRRAIPVVGRGLRLPEWTYDGDRQMAVSACGKPVIEQPHLAAPTAITTSSTDGEDPPSSEDWIND